MVQIEDNMMIIQDICQQFKVKKLFVFGSRVRKDFNEQSDIDFLVEFDRTEIKGSFDQYFDFKEALEQLFGKDVDLVCRKSIRNPIFKEEVESSKKVVYVA